MADNERRTIEIDIFIYNYLVKTENKLELIKKVATEKTAFDAMEIIKAILGIKETGHNG